MHLNEYYHNWNIDTPKFFIYISIIRKTHFGTLNLTSSTGAFKLNYSFYEAASFLLKNKYILS